MASASCDDAQHNPTSSIPEDLTIIVESDKTRILEAEKALAQQQRLIAKQQQSVRQRQQKLADQIKNLSGKKARQRQQLQNSNLALQHQEQQLQQQASALQSQRTSLETEKTTLLKNINQWLKQQPAPSLASREASLAQREAALADRETRLGQQLTAMQHQLQRIERTINQIKTHRKSPTLGLATCRKMSAQITTYMQRNGLWLYDLPALTQQQWQQAQQALKQRHATQACSQLTSIKKTVDSIQINAKFIQSKMRRVNTMLAQPNLQHKITPQTLSQLLSNINQALSQGRYHRANEKLNQIFTLLKSTNSPKRT